MLDSTKPIWSGELTNCGVILGTNALSSLDFQISLPDGSTLEPEGTTRALDAETSVDTTEKIETRVNKSSSAEQYGTPKNPITEKIYTTASHHSDSQITAGHTVRTLPTLWLASDLHLGSRQTKLACVQVKGIPSHTVQLGLLGPGTNLAKVHCDFVEELWTGEESSRYL